MAAMKLEIYRDDLFFHAVHGLCRVAEIKKSQKKNSYTLLPVSTNLHSKIRFTVPEISLVESGFNKLTGEREANNVLKYLKTGEKKKTTNHFWNLAVLIRTEAVSEDLAKFAKRRIDIQRALKNFTQELAAALQCPLTEAAAKVKENLSASIRLQPLVTGMIDNLSVGGKF